MRKAEAGVRKERPHEQLHVEKSAGDRRRVISADGIRFSNIIGFYRILYADLAATVQVVAGDERAGEKKRGIIPLAWGKNYVGEKRACAL